MRLTKLIVFLILIITALFSIAYFASRKQNESQKTSATSVTQKAFEPKTDSTGAITITVTPKELGKSVPSWDFEVVMDTHSENLDQDLTKISVLTDDMGNKFDPIAWEGDSPGGHHRQGVLKFTPIDPRPKSIELEISKIGGVNERIFKWGLM